MRLVGILLGFAGVLVCASVTLCADEADTLRDVKAAFERALSRYQYGQAWTLWESGDRSSRQHWTQAEFQRRMETRFSQIAGGHQVEILDIWISSPTVAVVLARCTLTSRRSTQLITTEYIFSFIHDEGEWRPVLANFLGLSAH